MCLLCTADLFDPAVLGFGQTSQTLPGLGGMEGSPGNTGTLSQPQSSLISAGNHSTVFASGDSTIDGLLIGTAWAEPTLNFAFPSDSSFFTSPYEIAPGQMDTGYVNSFVATSAAFQTVVRDMMSDLDGMLAVTFVETANTDAELVFARTTDTDLGTASGRFPSYGANQGHQWYRNHIYEQSPTMGSYTWATILHETGHTLGLAHAHSADSISGDFVGQVQPRERDNMEFTVMSYRSYENAPTTGYRNETYGFAQSFMMDDIAAMQYLYGADFTMNSGDTVYTFSTTTGEMFVDGVGQGTPGDNRIFRTLWDGDGTDTYDLSNYSQALEIDLTPGGWSKLDDAQRVDLGNGNLARANVYNARLFEEDARSLIENAVGGSSDDIIVGNRAKNRLEGGLGKDMLYGGGGVDTLLGGAGNDILYGDDAPPGPGAASGISLGTSTYSHGNTHGSFANAFEITDRFSFDDDANIADATTLAHTSLSFTGPGSGTVPAQYYAITITRGTVLILDLDDSANLDSWINVYNAGQEVLAFNDDAGGDPGSETE
ncbi:MAG: M10 family metallopeptidase C-terminal domain-containing protein, partial [Pseudomonadota bacterium]